MAERLKTRTPDLEVRDSSLGRCVVSLDEKLGNSLHFITLFTQVQAQMVTGDMLLRVTLRWTRKPSKGAVILLGLLRKPE